MIKQIRFSGSGGQGVITAAIIFAESAVNQGYHVVQSQSYGPEARGGASKAEVIISDKTIYHPKISSPDIVIALTQQAADKYYSDLDKDSGLLIIDEDLVSIPPPFSHTIKVPITKLASEKIGKTLFANIVALGILVKISNILSIDTVKNSLIKRIPIHTIEENTKALNLGYTLF